ncbi:hypothetical protein MAR_007645 [Mya arenaria]|uniref:Uncharacterized protein n=1 Tax=Mya arenaria TaxID=6604 RepID=A0ABY7DTP2_MYAAR|nr:hypothetical protein MAR_007645 [Mya arenaria]
MAQTASLVRSQTYLQPRRTEDVKNMLLTGARELKSLSKSVTLTAIQTILNGLRQLKDDSFIQTETNTLEFLRCLAVTLQAKTGDQTGRKLGK